MFTAFILLGLAATLGQILFLRELIVLFSGNELTIGLALAGWLMGTGLGSLLARCFKKIKPKNFFLSFTLLSFILPLSIMFIRLIKPFLGWGEVPSLPQLLGLTIFLVFPYALLTGALFTFSCAYLKGLVLEEKQVITKVYLGEALGAVLGGLLFYFVLCHYYQSLQIALYLSLLLAIYSSLQVKWIKQNDFSIISIGFLIIVLIATINWQGLEEKSRKWQWQPYKVITSKDTIYGQLTFLKNINQISVYESGLYAFSYPDQARVEHSVHLALLERPLPRSVLLIGGGVSSSLNEILKHPSIEKVTYVELDPTLIKLATKYLPAKITNILNDKRIKVIYQDGRLFVKKAKETYDVIILCLPDPLTAQLNRFYTKEFFKEIKAILSKEGIFCLGVSSSPDIIGLALGEFLRSIYFTLKTVFPELVALPGDTAYFLATPTKKTLTHDIDKLIKRLKERGLDVKYVQDYYLRAELSLFRLVYFRSILEKDKHYEINTDLRPRCYFYSLVLWGTTHFPTLREIVLKWRDLRLSHAVILICILGIFLFFLKTYFKPLPLLTAVGITGFTEISLEVVALISFQVFYGFVYSELALLITTFMLGLAIGSLIFYSHPPKSLIAWLRFLQVSLSLLSLFWLGVIYGLHEYKSLSQHPWFFHLIFPLFLGGAGTLGAMQFLTASQIYMGLGRGIKETAATLYSTDLLGSAMGAFLTSLIFLPLLGLPATLIFVVCLNLVALLILLFY